METKSMSQEEIEKILEKYKDCNLYSFCARETIAKEILNQLKTFGSGILTEITIFDGKRKYSLL